MDDLDQSRAWIRRYLRSRPPAPRVEDEQTSCAREINRPPVSWDALDGEPPIDSRGTIDQVTLLEEIAAPARPSIHINHDRRFVLLSHPSSRNKKPMEVAADTAHTLQHVAATSECSLSPSSRNGSNEELTDPSTIPGVTADGRERRGSAYHGLVNSELAQNDPTEIALETKPETQSTLPSSTAHPSPCTSQHGEPKLTSHDTIFTTSLSEHQSRMQEPYVKASPSPREDAHMTPPIPNVELEFISPNHAQISPTRQRSVRNLIECGGTRTIEESLPYQDDHVPQRPKVNIQSSPYGGSADQEDKLPYPDDDSEVWVPMPFEEHYQFDHSTVAVPDEPLLSKQSLGSGLDLVRKAANGPKSPSDPDDHWSQTPATFLSLLERPLPPCPRGQVSAKYVDWYTLPDYHLDLCPDCYRNVFADTIYASGLIPIRLSDGLERYCDFSKPWFRLAWLMTLRQGRESLELLGQLARVTASERPCPGDRMIGLDRMIWYGFVESRSDSHTAGFAVCSYDKQALDILLPGVSGYFTIIPSNDTPRIANQYLCSLRVSSRRFPKYLDLLVELDAEAQSANQAVRMDRFAEMIRANAFKRECGRNKIYVHKPWHFIPSLPSFTVCEECYDEVVWPATQDKSIQSQLPNMMIKAIQLVPEEDPEFGSSCCLYSPRMRRIWATAVENDDMGYLQQKALDRKRMEVYIDRERKGIRDWMARLNIGSAQWERARIDLRGIERDWSAVE